MEAAPFGFIIALIISVVVSGITWAFLRHKRLL
jgi:magnesium transporter